MYSKTFNYHDYAYLEPFIKLIDELKERTSHRLDHELRTWEYAMCAHALKDRGVKTVLDVGGAGSLLAPFLSELGYDVMVLDDHPDLSISHEQGINTLRGKLGQTDVAKYDAVIAISVVEHDPCPDVFVGSMILAAEKVVFLTTDVSETGQAFSEHHLKTYTPHELRQIEHWTRESLGWGSYHRPVYYTDHNHVFGQYTFGCLTLTPVAPVENVNFTLLSIMRDSTGYIGRYAQAVRSTLQNFGRGHLIVVEGDNTDRTREILLTMKPILESDGHRVSIVHYETGKSMFNSIDIPERWTALDDCWNEAMWHITPSEYVMCIESDLHWQFSNVAWGMACVRSGKMDVYYPLLMSAKDHTWMHDNNGFRKNGAKFTNLLPYWKEWNQIDPFVHNLDTGGGMIIGYGETFRDSTWKDNCRLHFKEGTRLSVDMANRIYHP